jgi:hypothetical protein
MRFRREPQEIVSGAWCGVGNFGLVGEEPDLFIPMHSCWRKRGQTNRNVFGTPRFGRGVLDPLTGICDHSLSGMHVKASALMLESQQSLEHDRELYEFRPLTRLNPTFRATHVCNASRGGSSVHAANVFVDDLGLVPRSFDPSRLRNQGGHAKTIAAGKEIFVPAGYRQPRGK